jgi:hypothetical protein
MPKPRYRRISDLKNRVTDVARPRYRRKYKTVELGLGSIASVTLPDARLKRDELAKAASSAGNAASRSTPSAGALLRPDVRLTGGRDKRKDNDDDEDDPL